jgi:hypothetical protein
MGSQVDCAVGPLMENEITYKEKPHPVAAPLVCAVTG